jgi:hypothetical protein
VLAVPSAVVPHEHSEVNNPVHPDIARAGVEAPHPCSCDAQMFKR